MSVQKPPSDFSACVTTCGTLLEGGSIDHIVRPGQALDKLSGEVNTQLLYEGTCVTPYIMIKPGPMAPGSVRP
jgi:hypothetical protein